MKPPKFRKPENWPNCLGCHTLTSQSTASYHTHNERGDSGLSYDPKLWRIHWTGPEESAVSRSIKPGGATRRLFFGLMALPESYLSTWIAIHIKVDKIQVWAKLMPYMAIFLQDGGPPRHRLRFGLFHPALRRSNTVWFGNLIRSILLYEEPHLCSVCRTGDWEQQLVTYLPYPVWNPEHHQACTLRMSAATFVERG